MIRDRIVVLPLLTLALVEGFPLSAQSVVSTLRGHLLLRGLGMERHRSAGTKVR